MPTRTPMKRADRDWPGLTPTDTAANKSRKSSPTGEDDVIDNVHRGHLPISLYGRGAKAEGRLSTPTPAGRARQAVVVAGGAGGHDGGDEQQLG